MNAAYRRTDKWMDDLPSGVVGLPSPIKVHDLVNTLEMMTQTLEEDGGNAGSLCGNEVQRRKP